MCYFLKLSFLNCLDLANLLALRRLHSIDIFGNASIFVNLYLPGVEWSKASGSQPGVAGYIICKLPHEDELNHCQVIRYLRMLYYI